MYSVYLFFEICWDLLRSNVLFSWEEYDFPISYDIKLAVSLYTHIYTEMFCLLQSSSMMMDLFIFLLIFYACILKLYYSMNTVLKFLNLSFLII